MAPKKISSRLGSKTGENAANIPQSAPIAGEEKYVFDAIPDPKEDGEKWPTQTPGVYGSGWLS